MSSEEDRRDAAERLKAFHGREGEGQIRRRQTRGRVAFIVHMIGWAIVVFSVLAIITIPLASGFDLLTGYVMLVFFLGGVVGYALTRWLD